MKSISRLSDYRQVRQVGRLVVVGLMVVLVPMAVHGESDLASLLKGTTPSAIVKVGLDLVLKRIPTIDLGFNLRNGAAYVRVASSGTPFVDPQLDIRMQELTKQINELQIRQKDATSSLRIVLEQQVEMLKVLSEQAKANAEYQAKLLQHQNRLFDYMKERDEGILRKLAYELPTDRLVVVVTDFSTGDPNIGREVADEIAAYLRQMADKGGLKLHILVGETRPGIFIRSEELARDIGRHFPSHTHYAVLWGTLPELTSGPFRVNLTSAYKRDNERGIAVTQTIQFDPSGEQPLKDDFSANKRELYRKVIATACGFVPPCYLAYKTGRDELVDDDLKQLATFFENDAEPIELLKKQYRPLLDWVSRLKRLKAKVERLGPLPLNQELAFPSRIVVSGDSSQMVLITAADGSPKVFNDPKTMARYVTYIDVTEVTIRQYSDFLTKEKHEKIPSEGGVAWYSDGESKAWHLLKYDNKRWSARYASDMERPITRVSWFGSRAYCEHYGKELPRKDEWLAAADRDLNANVTWEKLFTSNLAAVGRQGNWPSLVGNYETDQSRIGCFDLIGNVAEWCEDFADQGHGEREVRGGQWKDDAKLFPAISHPKKQPQVAHEKWLGFRGVLRINLDEAAK